MSDLNTVAAPAGDKAPSVQGGAPPSPEYAARWQRVMDCVALRQPDRMPVALHMMFWVAKYAGMTCKEAMFDRERVAAAAIEIVRELDPDLCCSSIMTIGFGPLLQATGYRQLEWPGGTLPDDRPYQFLDREYMTPEEYDEFLFDPTGFYFGKYLPRVASAFEGGEVLASLTGATYFEVFYGTPVFADPKLHAAMQRLSDAGRATMEHFGHSRRLMAQLAGMGYPAGFGTVTHGPYDSIADFFRGASAMMKDLYRRPDKVLQALDKMKALTLRRLARVKPHLSNPIVFIPVHWAPDAFMSQKQFERFWWPSFRELLLGIIEMGLIPMPLWEADCTKRLETIRDIPPGKCIYWFERTDMVRAHEVLGDVVALRGGMHPSVMTMGTPDEVDAAVKHLVDEVWNRGGRLILDTAFGIPDEAPVENVRAMYRAARKYAS